jgi:hypothetical protein
LALSQNLWASESKQERDQASPKGDIDLSSGLQCEKVFEIHSKIDTKRGWSSTSYGPIIPTIIRIYASQNILIKI